MYVKKAIHFTYNNGLDKINRQLTVNAPFANNVFMELLVDRDLGVVHASLQVINHSLQGRHCSLHLFWCSLDGDLVLAFCELDVNFGVIFCDFPDVSSLFANDKAV